MKFIYGQPALCIGKTMVVADLHLGIESEFRRSGLRMPSQTESVLKKLIGLLKETKCNRVVILGDVKHTVFGSSFQEERELAHFFASLAKHARVYLVKGNHDGGIERYTGGNAKVHPASGFLYRGYYLCHGHAKPTHEAEKAKALICAHSHFVFEIRDRLGARWNEKVWVRARPLQKIGKLEEIVIMPAFSDLVGGKAIDREAGRGVAVKLADLKNAQIYLLDGTFLGTSPRTIL